MKRQKLAQITAQELRRRPWYVYAERGRQQLRITSVSDDGALGGLLAGRKIFGGIDWRTCSIVFRQEVCDKKKGCDIRYVRAHRGFAFVMKRDGIEKWVMSGTFLTFEPEIVAPWRQEFGWFAEQE